MALVVIADDDLGNRTVLGLHLQLRGHSVRAVVDGEEVLSLVARERPDLVLLDLHMPRLDGPDTCACLRLLPEMAGVPIVLVTGTDRADLPPHVDPRTFDAFLPKPYEMTDLWDLTDRLLGSASLSAAAPPGPQGSAR